MHSASVHAPWWFLLILGLLKQVGNQGTNLATTRLNHLEPDDSSTLGAGDGNSQNGAATFIGFYAAK